MLIRMLLAISLAVPLSAQTAPPAAAGVQPTAEAQRLMPPSVYFSGQTATVQQRNSAVYRFADGKLVLTGLVDTGGYSTSLRQRYQFYLMSDVALDLGGGKKLPAGAYGCGFLPQIGLLVMDLGGEEVLRVPTADDAELRRPRPLQMVAGSGPNSFRLYLGRSYVTIARAK